MKISKILLGFGVVFAILLVMILILGLFFNSIPLTSTILTGLFLGTIGSLILAFISQEFEIEIGG